MSPVEKGPRVSPRTALVVAIAGVVAGAGLFVLVSFLADRGDVVEVQLGDDTFDAGDAEDIAGEVADNGPILYPDLVGQSRTIYLNHLGDDPETGWVAFDAFRPGSRDCALEWEPEREGFVDTCDGTEIPPDGEGLPSYPVVVEDGTVIVDLNAAFRTTTTIRVTGVDDP